MKNSTFLIVLFLVAAVVCLVIFNSTQNKSTPPKADVKTEVNNALRNADPASSKAYCDCYKALANSANCRAAKGTFAHDILCVNDIVNCCIGKPNTDGVACQMLGNTFSKC